MGVGCWALGWIGIGRVCLLLDHVAQNAIGGVMGAQKVPSYGMERKLHWVSVCMVSAQSTSMVFGIVLHCAL